MDNFREIIKNRRIEKGVSQNKLAKELGITQTFMSEIESGRKSPSIEMLYRICEQLNIEIHFKVKKTDG